MPTGCGEWKARHERRPGQPAVLMVTGECKIPATYRAVLKQSEQQGEDPTQLVLDLVVTLPSGLGNLESEKRATLNVSFKLPTENEYKTVRIIDVNSQEGESWEIPVRVLEMANTPKAPKSRRWEGVAPKKARF